jgi:endonuclease YncB( thermonuclease family)
MHQPLLLPVGFVLALVVIGTTICERRGCAADAAAPEAAAPENDANELPTIVVPQRPVHMVPDSDPTPGAPVTLKGRDGRAVALRSPPVPTPRRPAPAPWLTGAAQPLDGASLRVAGRIVKLFGVRLAPAGDRCAPDGDSPPRGCSEAGRQALAAQISGEVSCHTPPGQSTAQPGAVCVDAGGVDLGRLLVSEGLALADTSQSYDYVGVEGSARSAHRGLWRYR